MSNNLQDGNLQPNYRKLKKLYNKIRKQMEFYFSDSNLAKDKFLFDLISKDPDGFVEIDVFKKFNKIRALTNNSDLIAESVTKSDFFEISADRKKIKRTVPLELSKDFDACTLYVEKLPQNADQKWVKDVLGQFGAITYVNVPRYKATNKIKGFAFVEFGTPEGVKKACEFYKIPSEKDCTASEDEEKCAKSNPHQKSKRKRKRCSSEGETVLKKTKVATGEVPNISETKESVNENKASCDSKTEQVDMKVSKPSTQLEGQIAMEEEKAEVSNTPVNGTTIDPVKNRRRRRSSKKHSSEKTILRVMPKSEWKAYRSKYLDLQRSTMKLIKKQILHEMQEFKEQECSTKPVDAPETKKSLQFMPGIIIKVKLNEPIKNPSEIKTQVKANAIVAYVDAPVDSSEIFIRCHSSDDAQTILKEKKFSNLGKVQLTEGEEEKKYWEKIETDRNNKLSNPVVHKKRGRDKLLAKAAKLEEIKNKHIYFDD